MSAGRPMNAFLLQGLEPGAIALSCAVSGVCLPIGLAWLASIRGVDGLALTWAMFALALLVTAASWAAGQRMPSGRWRNLIWGALTMALTAAIGLVYGTGV